MFLNHPVPQDYLAPILLRQTDDHQAVTEDETMLETENSKKRPHNSTGNVNKLDQGAPVKKLVRGQNAKLVNKLGN